MIKVCIDIGNSKISCAVSDIKEIQSPEILSFISVPTLNINKGTFTNFQSIKKEIKEVINIAQKESQTQIKSINLNLPLSGSNSKFYNSTISIENELINELHLKKAINQSEFFNDSLNQHTILNYIISYEIDDKA